jgi:hypothetical protein
MSRVFAQGVDIGSTFNSPWGMSLSLGDLTSNILVAAMALAGIITIFLFIFGGLKIISGAGSSDSRSTAEGKQAITWAVIGFIVVFTAYWATQLFTAITGYRLF